MKVWKGFKERRIRISFGLLFLAGVIVAFRSDSFSRLLTYNVYRFNVKASDKGATRQLNVEAYRGTTLLTIFQTATDGAVVGADVADIDQNHFPELYIFVRSDGSGSFGRIYGWQFLSQRKAEIKTIDWRLKETAYMGHDSLWIEKNLLCRRIPLYRPGDTNAEPTGGSRTIRYHLEPAGNDYVLKIVKSD